MKKQLLIVLVATAVTAVSVVYLNNKEPAVDSYWASTDEWRLDWLDSIEAHNEIIGAADLLFDDWSRGLIHPSEFRNFSQHLSDLMMTHVDYFKDKVPPREAEKAHDLFIQAFRLSARALEQSAMFEFDAGVALLDQSTEATRRIGMLDATSAAAHPRRGAFPRLPRFTDLSVTSSAT